MKSYRGTLVSLSLALALGALNFGASEAYAQGRAKASAKAELARKVEDLAAKIESASPEEALSGLEMARDMGKEVASLAPKIEGVLVRGSTVEIMRAALEALSEVGAEPASSVIRPYARHRRPELRRAAVEALGKIGGIEAVLTLRRALGDADPDVRNMAARGLGALGARMAEDDLFISLERGIDEAAPALARLCVADSCERLAQRLHALPFEMTSRAIEELLSRSDITNDRKVSLVHWLRDRKAKEAPEFLRRLSSRLREPSPELQKAIDDAISELFSPKEAP